jgi:hypothetical protein
MSQAAKSTSQQRQEINQQTNTKTKANDASRKIMEAVLLVNQVEEQLQEQESAFATVPWQRLSFDRAAFTQAQFQAYLEKCQWLGKLTNVSDLSNSQAMQTMIDELSEIVRQYSGGYSQLEQDPDNDQESIETAGGVALKCLFSSTE